MLAGGDREKKEKGKDEGRRGGGNRCYLNQPCHDGGTKLNRPNAVRHIGWLAKHYI
jgi:hypothetical protein